MKAYLETDNEEIAVSVNGALRQGSDPLFSTGRMFPSANITVYRSRIVIVDRWPARQIDIPKAEVVGIRRRFIVGEVEIVHRIPGLPSYVGFAAGFGGIRLLWNGLRSFGYPIATRKQSKPLGERLYLPSIVVPIAAGMAALFTAWILNVHGIQPLSEPEMISAGRQVSTALFSAKATMVFAISGFALLGCGLISLTRQLLKIRNALHAER